MGRPLVLPPLGRTWEDAARFAFIVHDGQADKAGAPYFEHVQRVASRVLNLADSATDAAQQIAYLHDVMEPDERPYGRIEWHCLVAEGFSPFVIRAVDILTRKAGETYGEYIERVALHGATTGILVKIADLEDNLDTDRLGKLDPAKAASLRKRYEPALARLRAALADPAQPR